MGGPTASDQWSLGSLAKANKPNPFGGSDASFKIAQRISCTLHRENARARFSSGHPSQCGIPMSVPRVRTVLAEFVGPLSSLCLLPVPGSGLFWGLCFCLHQETDHGDTWTSSFFSLSRRSLSFSLTMSSVIDWLRCSCGAVARPFALSLLGV